VTISPEFPATPPATAVTVRTVDLRGKGLTLAGLRAAVPRAQHQTVADAEQKVLDIIGDVRERGYAALTEYAQRFDGVQQDHPRVPAGELVRALAELDPAVRKALEESISRARRFADSQRPRNIDVELGDGAIVSQNWVPVTGV
jgi:histidinol dehydrogenase